ncbi:MAG: energy-coupling factor transporter transmembrane protein EcfT [Eubacteriales bacterium]|nr:energy-coupling factor transporter transmembrane protein EcfT [Eubacteriales bacterium]
MLRDITIGQYIAGDSPVHKMDARVKILATLLFVVLLFVIRGVAEYAILTLFLGFVIKLSKVPFKFMVKGLKAMLFILAFTVLINVLLTDGTPLFLLNLKIFTLKVTYEGVEMGIYMLLRLVYLIIGTSVLTLTTSPLMLTDGIERLLRPLRIIKVPSHEIAMMMTIAIRFIPTIAEEADKIMKAQSARGADFESGSVIRRAKAMIPLLVPLFVSSFRRADDLAVAMDSRCYHGGANRTRMKEMKMGRYDAYAAAIFLLLITALVIIRIAAN